MPFDAQVSRRGMLLGLAAGALSGQEPAGAAIDVLEAGTGGYRQYRIPGIVVTKRNTAIAYAEARRNNGSDWDDIGIVVRRSTDGGRTFDPSRILPHVEGVTRNPVAIERKLGQPEWRTYNNPAAIAARDGRVHFLFCAEYMRVFYMRSDNDGRTFTAPVEITAALEPLRKQYAWRIAATGPGHGIELRNGRLLVPVWLALATDAGHSPSANTTIYSDDRGRTWHAGEMAVVNQPDFPNANETAVIERADGSVVMNIRTVSPRNRRAISTSPDGISRWSAPRFDETLTDPICAAGLLRVPRKSGPPLWAFSNPDCITRADGKPLPNKDRRNLTLRFSRDEGVTWPVAKVLEPGAAGYSDLAARANGTILCFYETKTPAGVAVLRLAFVPAP